MIRFILPFALLMSVPAYGDMPSMKRQNFELVNVGTSVSTCPFVEEDMAEIWESELLRARLKKNAPGDFEVGYLWLDVSCMEFKNQEGFYQYSFRLSWTWSEKRPDAHLVLCLLYTSPSPRDGLLSRMPSSA